MAFEIMDRIRKAEEEADKLRQDAQRKGRDIVQASEEAVAADERSADKEIREIYNRSLQERREQVEQMIEDNRQKLAAVRESAHLQALSRVPEAARYIVERVLSDGHR